MKSVLAAPLLELSSTTAIKAAVAEGVGPAVLSSLAVTGELADGTLVSVRVLGLDVTRVLCPVFPKTWTLTGAAKEPASIAARGGSNNRT
ncbi:MAG: hypothetical protein QOI83_379 [Streptomycetaceae bacterium]|nr:hypothetical protein [Streptomycetaceae bacterium]